MAFLTRFDSLSATFVLSPPLAPAILSVLQELRKCKDVFSFFVVGSCNNKICIFACQYHVASSCGLGMKNDKEDISMILIITTVHP